ncbi:MAG: kynureninase [Gammaproteobacteria bacterium]
MNKADLDQWDVEDPLAHFRNEFALPDKIIYLNGNSLGAAPKATRENLIRLFDKEWSADLSRSWNTHGWFNLPEKVGANIAKLIGAESHEVIVADSTSVNIFKLLTAAIRLRSGRNDIVVLHGDFPTDIYIAQGVANLLPQITLRTESIEDLEGVIGSNTAVVMLTHVNYRSGEIHDMEKLTRMAHERGALILWDLSHSTGALPVDLNACRADFSVGCGYKFLNGGPGAPAYLFVAERHQNHIQPVLSGWIGHAVPFNFEDGYQPAAGIRRNLCGTHSVTGLTALETGVEMFLKADMRLVRKKSQKLGDLFIELIDPVCTEYGFELASPRDNRLRGSQVSLKHPQGYAIKQALNARDVIIDFRAPDILRFGLTPLYLRYTDIRETVCHIKEVMQHREWERPEFNHRDTVT